MGAGVDMSVMGELTALYLRQLKERLSTLEKVLIEFKLGPVLQPNYDTLEFEVHRLNGTGATYGFPEITATAKTLEEYLRSGSCEQATVIKRLESLVNAIGDTLINRSIDLPKTQATVRPKGARSSYRPTILVIDDDPAILNLVMQLLSPWVEVECADNGVSAIEALERRRYDLVLLDYNLPDMSGLEVLTRVNPTESIIKSPVMMLTAMREPASVSRLIAAGARHYLVKPIEPDQLIERVLFLLNRQKKVIMVVDDDPLIREIFRKRLIQRGHEVILATNGVQALGLVRKAHPQTIVLDRQMPRLNGMEFLKELRREEQTRSIPVVMLSALSTSDDVYSGYREGADAYIAKPFVPDQVIECCEGFLRPHDLNAQIESAKSAWEGCVFV